MIKKYEIQIQGLVFLASTASMMGASPSEAAIIKKYDFESGTYSGVSRQYQDKTCSSSSDYIDNKLFDIVPSPGGRTGNAVKHQIKNCDERSELVIPANTLKNDQDYWLGWSYFLPSNFITPQSGQPDYTIVQQMAYYNSWIDQDNGKTLYDCNPRYTRNGVEKTGGAPGSEMTISPDGKRYDYKVKYYRGQDSQGRYLFGCKSFTLPAKLNTWEDFVMNLKASANPNVGYLRLWKNDKLYINEKVALSRPGVESVGDWKIGAYVGDPNRGERILYTDEIRLGNSSSNYLEVVNPARRNKLSGLDANNSTISSFAAAVNPAASVPEPSMLVGLLAIGGAAVSFGLKRH